MDYNSPEEVEKRASQEDPLVMYLIVRESLGMSIGKTAAQCAHASQMLQLRFSKISDELTDLEEQDNLFGSLTAEQRIFWNENHPLYFIFSEWLSSSFRKVVLRADNKEWEKVKAEISNKVVVVDAGLTEIAPFSETVIGLWPIRKSQAPKIIKKLQVLK